jgi:hypothetical protein
LLWKELIHIVIMEHFGACMSVIEPEPVGRKRTSQRAKRSTTTRSTRPRSAITSGRQLFIAGDPKSAWSRRYHDLIIGHCNDAGGVAALSEARLSLIRPAASLECELERLDAMLSTGAEVSLDSYGRAASHLRRLFETLGIERKARDVTLIDGTVEAPWSPMRERLRAEAAAVAKEDLAP